MTRRKADKKNHSAASMSNLGDRVPAKSAFSSRTAVAEARGLNEESAAVISRQEKIALLAYTYWVQRGRQGGSPDEDWFRAEREIDLGSSIPIASRITKNR